MTCERRADVSAYVLGVLEPADSEGLRSHLAHCPWCREEQRSLSGMPRLLRRVPADAVPVSPVEPSRRAYRKLLAAAHGRAAGWPGWLPGAAAAVLVAVLVVTGVAIVTGGRDSPSSPTSPTTVVASRSGSVRAQATLSGVASGTRISLSLSGVRPGQRCRLRALGRDGESQVASTWTATYRGSATVTGSVRLRPAQIDRLVVETLDGRTLVSLPTTSRRP